MEQTTIEAATPAQPEPVKTVTESAPSASPTPTVSDPVKAEAGPTENGSQSDTFTQIDVNTLPPELKGKYDSMLSDYKKKTTEIAQFKRDWESAQEKVRFADLALSDPDIVNVLNSKYAPQSQESETQAPGVDQNVVKEIQKLKSDLVTRDAQLVIKEFKASHTDFDTYKDLISGYVTLNPPKTNSEKDMKDTLETAYNYFKGLKTSWYEEGKKEGLSRVDQKTAQSTVPPSPSQAPAYTGDPKKLSVSEAVELARRGIRVQR